MAGNIKNLECNNWVKSNLVKKLAESWLEMAEILVAVVVTRQETGIGVLMV